MSPSTTTWTRFSVDLPVLEDLRSVPNDDGSESRVIQATVNTKTNKGSESSRLIMWKRYMSRKEGVVGRYGVDRLDLPSAAVS